jgi:hypothetical protein
MGRKAAIFWHAALSLLAGAAYYFAVLPRQFELMGEFSHGQGTAGRIGCGILVGLAALPVVLHLLQTRKPEFGTPALALNLRIVSIAAHLVAAVLIVGAAVAEIWLSLNAAGQWLFGVYGAAAAVGVLGILAFELSFVAELPPPPPKPLKPKKDKRRKRGKTPEGTDAEAATEAEAEPDTEAATEAEAGSDESTAPAETEAAEVEPVGETHDAGDDAAGETEPQTDDLPTAEDTVAVEAPRGGLRNRRPSGKSAGSRRRRRLRGGVALDD